MFTFNELKKFKKLLISFLIMKKSQAAMEFLITYSWAILAVLVIVAGIYYSGIFNPRLIFSKDICEIPVVLSCDDFAINKSNSKLLLLLSNTLGYHINILEIKFESSDFSCNIDFSSCNTNYCEIEGIGNCNCKTESGKNYLFFNKNYRYLIKMDCLPVSKRKYVKGKLIIKYFINGSSINDVHNVTGDLFIKS